MPRPPTGRPRGRPAYPGPLTPAEQRVLMLVRAGRSNPEIATELGLGLATVKFHVSNMLAKLELRSRDELAAWDGAREREPDQGHAAWRPRGVAWIGGAFVALAAVVTAAALIALARHSDAPHTAGASVRRTDSPPAHARVAVVLPLSNGDPGVTIERLEDGAAVPAGMNAVVTAPGAWQGLAAPSGKKVFLAGSRAYVLDTEQWRLSPVPIPLPSTANSLSLVGWAADETATFALTTRASGLSDPTGETTVLAGVWRLPLAGTPPVQLADAGEVGAVRAWFSPQLNLVLVLRTRVRDHDALRPAPASELLAVSTGGGVAWQMPLPDVVDGYRSGMDAHSPAVVMPAGVVSPDGTRLYVVHAQDDGVTVVDLLSRTATIRVPHDPATVLQRTWDRLAGWVGTTAEAKGGTWRSRAAALSPAGDVLYVSGEDGLDAETDCARPRSFNSCHTAGSHGLVSVDTATFEILGRDERVASFVLSPDGAFLIATGWRQRSSAGRKYEPDVGAGVRVLEGRTLDEVAVLERDSIVTSMVIDRTGRYLYVSRVAANAGPPNRLRVYDLATGQRVGERILEVGDATFVR